VFRPTNAVVVLALAAALFIVAEYLRAKIVRWLIAMRLRSQAKRSLRAEAWAAELLRAEGYRLVGAQVAGSYELWIDGRRHTVLLRADYVVERDRRRFVAEVKSGKAAPSLDTAATRRQLLEYRVAFAVDGVLLVDGETGFIHEVVFPLAGQRSVPRSRHAVLAPF
jgi:hypothetical protein